MVDERGNLKMSLIQLAVFRSWFMKGYKRQGVRFCCSPVVTKFIVILVVLVIPAKSVESREQTREPLLERQVMLVALGPLPPRRYGQKIKRGDAAMLLPKEHEVPPNKLYYRAKGKDQDVAGEWVGLQLAFNNIAAMHSVEAGRDLVLYRKNPSGYERYVTVPAEAAGITSIVFLTPPSPGKNKSQSWLSKPHVTIISPSLPSLKGKQVIIANLSKLHVLHAFDEKVTSVDPGQIIAYHRKRPGVLYHLAARYGIEKKMIYNMAIRLESHAGAHLYALYDALPATNAGRSVGVFRLMMPAL